MASRTTRTAQPGARGDIIDALNREWRRLDHDSSGVVRDWADNHRIFTGCRTVGEVLGAVRTRSDDGLHALLAEVAVGDDLAGRVVLQSMIGRLVVMARSDPRCGVDDYISAMWCEIKTYPLSRRPVRIAANLALDTLKAVRREHRWLVRGEVTTWPPGELLDEIFAGAGAVSAAMVAGDVVDARAVLAAGRRLSIIDDTAEKLLTSVYVDGLSGSDAAHRHQTTAGSLRVRCSRAVGRLARAAPEILVAA